MQEFGLGVDAGEKHCVTTWKDDCLEIVSPRNMTQPLRKFGTRTGTGRERMQGAYFKLTYTMHKTCKGSTT